MKTTLTIIGDWRKEVGVPLHDALRVSVQVCGRTALEACKHFIIVCAQSARAITTMGKKKRPVEQGIFADSAYVMKYSQAYPPLKLHLPSRKASDYQSRKQQLTRIGRAGLAKASWMWGLKGLNQSVSTEQKEIAGVADAGSWTDGTLRGYEYRNRLSYLLKQVMPIGWAAEVYRRAGNKVLAQARLKLERQFKASMRAAERKGAAIGRGIAEAFS